MHTKMNGKMYPEYWALQSVVGQFAPSKCRCFCCCSFYLIQKDLQLIAQVCCLLFWLISDY